MVSLQPNTSTCSSSTCRLSFPSFFVLVPSIFFAVVLYLHHAREFCIGFSEIEKQEEDQGCNGSATSAMATPAKSTALEATPSLQNFCPGALCATTPLCRTCDQKYIFVISMARAGSTTLMKMIGMLPGVRLSGENGNELYVASQLMSHLKRYKQMAFNKEIADGPWRHGPIQREAFACVMQSLVMAINPPLTSINNKNDNATFLGFKTIRVHLGEWKAEKAAEFFMSSFPCSKFLVNVRTNLTELLLSREKFLPEPKVSEAELRNVGVFYRNLSVEFGERAFFLDLSQWQNDVMIINEAVNWLGFPFCTFSSLVHENYNGFGRDNRTSPLSCRGQNGR